METIQKKEGAQDLNLERWLQREDAAYIVDGQRIDFNSDDSKKISSKLLPQVHKKLLNLGRIERAYQTALINVALIQYLDKKEKELGIDLEKVDFSKISKRPNEVDLRRLLPKS